MQYNVNKNIYIILNLNEKYLLLHHIYVKILQHILL